jgi:hypothetical protein
MSTRISINKWKRNQYATSRKVSGWFPDEVIGFFDWPNNSSRTMILRSTQPLTEMSTMYLPGGKGRPEPTADNLTTICEPTVQKMWVPRSLTTLWTCAACYRDNFTFFTTSYILVSYIKS